MAESRFSRSSILLDALLKEGGPEAGALSDEKTSQIHRTQIWKYRTGKRKPDAETIARIERLSGGRVPANGWEDLSAEQATEFVSQLAAQKLSAVALDETTPPQTVVAKRNSSRPPGPPEATSDEPEHDTETQTTPPDVPPVKLSELNKRTDTHDDDRGNVLPDERAQSLPELGGRTVDTSDSQLDPEDAA